MMKEVEQMAELLMEQASDLMFVGLTKAEDEMVASEGIRKRQG